MTRTLNKREIKKVVRRDNEVKVKRISKIIIWVSIFSIVPILLSVMEYYKTIVDYKILISIYVFSGLLFGVITKNYFQRTLSDFKVKNHLFWSVIVSGAISTSVFFIINNTFSNIYSHSVKVPIIEIHKKYSQKGSIIHVTVEFLNFTKVIPFPYEDNSKVDSSNFVVLDVSKGGLGFDIIRDKNLVK